jgi:RimJ/RimL family protein N-acetyltransferase
VVVFISQPCAFGTWLFLILIRSEKGKTTMKTIETERLTIRRLTMEDLNDCEQILIDAGWVDPNDTPEESLSKRKTWLEWSVRNYDALANLYQPPYGDLAVTLKGETRLIGSVGIVPGLAPYGQLPYYKALGLAGDERLFFPEVGMFWAFLKPHRGKGYATEAAQGLVDFAFSVLKLRRILAWTEYENENSMAVMRRLGMTIEKNPLSDPPWFQVVGILENPDNKLLSQNQQTKTQVTTP